MNIRYVLSKGNVWKLCSIFPALTLNCEMCTLFFFHKKTLPPNRKPTEQIENVISLMLLYWQISKRKQQENGLKTSWKKHFQNSEVSEKGFAWNIKCNCVRWWHINGAPLLYKSPLSGQYKVYYSCKRHLEKYICRRL